MTADWINAAFELLGATLQWMSVLRLLRDRQVAGVYWPVTAFFAAWGFWNIFYYRAVSSPASAAAAGVLCAANLAWVALAIQYSRRLK